MTNPFREAGIAKLRRQWEESEPITQEALDAMIKARRERALPEAEISRFADTIVVGQTRFIFFMQETSHDGYVRLDVMKVAAISLAEAITKLDEIGEYIAQEQATALPRLSKWA